jgi:glycosyltransferase involved in cell wall biosynthesis
LLSKYWLCCQLGAREHYAIPRALCHKQTLAHLITDAWVSPNSLLGQLPFSGFNSLQNRFHSDLEQANVHHKVFPFLAFELYCRLRKITSWNRIIARNHWFQNSTLKILDSIFLSEQKPSIFFAYSYAALEIFKYAKKQECITILGQIDPGPLEAEIVKQEHSRYPELAPTWEPPPQQYWKKWAAECNQADCIIVNSAWSRQALEMAGISTKKIKILPLAYEAPPKANTFKRSYPDKFSPSRPLRVLFLGQVILRKGLAAILEAAYIMRHEPIQIYLVGPVGINIPPQVENINCLGVVPRSQVDQYYQAADVFLFPTLSDGFGLTQLEAQAWQLPIIASQYCGEVVQSNINGMILPEVSGHAIAQSLHFCLHNPDKLSYWACHSKLKKDFDLESLSYSLQSLDIINK